MKRLALGLVLAALAVPAYAQPPNLGSVPQPMAIVDSTGAQICIAGAPCVTSSAGPAAAVVSTNASSTVTLGGTYQTVFAASVVRLGCTIQNPATATEVLNVRVKSLAVFTLPVGATFQCGGPGGVIISDLIEVTAATTSHAFTAVSQ